MDIGEFLDRELADLGSEFKEDNKEEKTASKESESPLIENIESNLSKGSLEEAERAYMQLWHLLAQQKLEWNRDIYGQLHSLSIRMSGILSQAHEEAKRKISHIMELASRGRNAMKEGKKDLPLKIYAEMQDTNNSIPNVFFEEKKMAQEQVMGYYREITSANDAELIKKVSMLAQEVSRLLDSIVFYIKSGDFANASSGYDRCLQLYNQVPEGFLLVRSQFGTRLLDIYKNLSIQMQILSLQGQLAQHQAIQPQMPKMQPLQAPQQKIAYQRPAEQKYRVSRARPAILQKTQQKRIIKEAKEEKPAKDALKGALPRHSMIERKREQAKRNIKKGFYNEAWKNIEEALEIDPKDVEAKALKAKIKTLQ